MAKKPKKKVAKKSIVKKVIEKVTKKKDRIELTTLVDATQKLKEGYRIVEVISAKTGSAICPAQPKKYIMEK